MYTSNTNSNNTDTIASANSARQRIIYKRLKGVIKGMMRMMMVRVSAMRQRVNCSFYLLRS